MSTIYPMYPEAARREAEERRRTAAAARGSETTRDRRPSGPRSRWWAILGLNQ